MVSISKGVIGCDGARKGATCQSASGDYAGYAAARLAGFGAGSGEGAAVCVFIADS
jgi:hypothetical protein